MKTDFSLIIPTYNESQNIAALCRKLTDTLSSTRLNFEIIIVDDDSPDQTWKIAEDLAREDQRIRVIHRTAERGLATAVLAGWAKAEGEILGVIDGDLQHPPEILLSMLAKIRDDSDTDIVVASRHIKGGGVSKWSLGRRLISRSATFLSAILIPKIFKKVKDPMSGYFILHRSVIEGKGLTPIGYKILLEILARGSYRKVTEVPYTFEERKKGGSKAGIRQYFISLLHFLRLSFNIK